MVQILLEIAGMIATTLLLLSGVGLALVLRELRKAPEGYEDENGFHITSEPALDRPRKFVHTHPRPAHPATAH